MSTLTLLSFTRNASITQEQTYRTIAHETGLHWSSVRESIETCIALGMVTKQPDERAHTFTLTKKGEAVTKQLKALYDLLCEYPDPIEPVQKKARE